MVNIGHVIYKADDLDQAVIHFRDKGFDVEYGQPKNPRNAVIYFSSGPYLEILSKVVIPRFAREYLKLIGQQRQILASDSVAMRPQGYTRIVFETNRQDFAELKKVYQEYGLRAVTCPVSRKDPHGRLLSCRCLMPDDWSIPMFVTPFAVDTHRDAAHPNGVTRIDEIFFKGSEAAVGICHRVGVEDRLTCAVGEDEISVTFV